GGSAGPKPEACPREDVDPSGLRSPSRELREGVGERIARDRQDDPRKDGRRAGDSSREPGDDEDARSEEGTDVEGDGVSQGDDSMKPGPGALLFLEIWGGRLSKRLEDDGLVGMKLVAVPLDDGRVKPQLAIHPTLDEGSSERSNALRNLLTERLPREFQQQGPVRGLLRHLEGDRAMPS